MKLENQQKKPQQPDWCISKKIKIKEVHKINLFTSSNPTTTKLACKAYNTKTLQGKD